MATYDLTQSIPDSSALAADDVLNCTYTGSEISIKLAAGRYKIEAYGAAGATNTRNTSYAGGEGGHSYGTISFEDDTLIYLNAGGTGGSGASSSSTKNAEGYNGGGYSYYYAGSGGGATHVATASGLLSTLSDNTGSIIIVAGGGGGSAAYSTYSYSSSYCGAGGKGGGEEGEHGYYSTSNTSSNALKYGGSGGTQSSGGAAGTSTSRAGSAGSFGQGGNGGTASSSYYGEGGGGGGYYGGGGGSSYEAGGGGGSGYLSSALTDALTEQGGNTGNGYITITVLEIYQKTHTITFYDGTTVLGSVETGGEETIALPTAPSKDGYKFLGYFLADGTTEITADSYASKKLTADVACFATYRKYKITFQSNGSSYYEIFTTGKETVSFPANPTQDGYDFVEWQLNGTTFDQAYLDANYLTDDITVEAAFRQKYAVRFVCDGMTYKEVQSSGYESISAPTTVPSKDGYTFEGWYLTSAYVTAYSEDYFTDRQINEATTIYGKLTEDCPDEPTDKSDVNFYVSGEVYYTFSTKGKESITMPEDPTVSGYRFRGWYADLSYSSPVDASYLLNRWINKEVKVYAKLEEIVKYEIAFYVNGKKYYTSKSAGEETLKTPTSPKVANYEFQGWYWDSSYSDPYDPSKYESTELTEDLKVYAKMAYTKQNTISFYLTTDAAEPYSTIVTTGCEELTLPMSPTADIGYEFKGWFLDKKLTVSFNLDYYKTHYLTKDISVYASFVTSTTGPYNLVVKHDGDGVTDPDVGTYSIAKGTTTTIKITKNEQNFKYLTINGETVDVTEERQMPDGAVGYFTFDEDSTDKLNNTSVETSGTPSINSATVKFGNGAIYLNGSSYILITCPDEFSDEFSVEFWFYTSVANKSGYYPTIFSTSTTSNYGGTYWAIDDGAYGTYNICRANAAGATSNNGKTGSTIVTRDAWHHFMFCRSGSNNYYFLDGVLQATVTQSSPEAISAICIGTLYRGTSGTILSSDYTTCYVDDLAIWDSCKHTSDFTVQTAALDLSAATSWSYIIEKQAENVEAIAYFGEYQTFNVTSSAEDGTISPEGQTSVLEGTTQDFTFSGNNDKELKAFLVDGVAVEVTKTGTYSYDDAICLCTFDDTIKDDTSQCTITQVGTPVISASKRKFGASSLYLNGSSYLSIALPSTYSSGFTVELWFYSTKEKASGISQTPMSWGAGTANGLTYFGVDDGDYSDYALCRSNLRTSSSSNGGYDDTSVTITRNEWHHLAVSRTTSACYFFVDGTLRKTVTNSSPVYASTVNIGALVGAAVTEGSYFCGYIDEVVIYPSAKYAAAFDVPTSAYEATISNMGYKYTLRNTHNDREVRAIFSPLLYLKIDDSWKGIAKVYKRVSGVWVEQASSDLASLFSTTENYAQGIYTPETDTTTGE